MSENTGAGDAVEAYLSPEALQTLHHWKANVLRSCDFPRDERRAGWAGGSRSASQSGHCRKVQYASYQPSHEDQAKSSLGGNSEDFRAPVWDFVSIHQV